MEKKERRGRKLHDPKNKKLIFIEFFTDTSKNLMKECRNIKPERRPDFSDIVEQVGRNISDFYKDLDLYRPQKKVKFLKTKADLDASKLVVNIKPQNPIS